MSYRLLIREGEDDGSFIYSLPDENDYYNTEGLSELIDCMNGLEFEVLKEKPHYHHITNQDIEIIEGCRKKILHYYAYED